MKKTILALFTLLVADLSANNPSREIQQKSAIADTIIFQEVFESVAKSRPSPILSLIHARKKKNKRSVAAALAFPFPFGIVGLHRIYLGTAPYVPVVYIGSLGGAFGILPFIDFCVIMMDKDIDRYINNQKVFMWVH